MGTLRQSWSSVLQPFPCSMQLKSPSHSAVGPTFPQASFVSYRMLSILIQDHGEKHTLKGDDSSIFFIYWLASYIID